MIKIIDSLLFVLLQILGKIVTPGIALYATISQLRKMVRENKLEDRLEKAIQEYKNKTNNENKNKNIKTANKAKENQTSIGKKKYRDELLKILGDNASKADILYGSIEDIEKKLINLNLNK